MAPRSSGRSNKGQKKHDDTILFYTKDFVEDEAEEDNNPESPPAEESDCEIGLNDGADGKDESSDDSITRLRAPSRKRVHEDDEENDAEKPKHV